MLGRRDFLLGSVVATATPKSKKKKKRGKQVVWSNQAPNSITIPPGATSGQRIVINSTGIFGYDNNNFLEFAIEPNGEGYTAGDSNHVPGETMSLDAGNNPITGQPAAQLLIQFNTALGTWAGSSGLNTAWENPGAGGATERTHVLLDGGQVALDPGLAEVELLSATPDTITKKPELRLNVFDTFTGNPTQGITVTPNLVQIGTPASVGAPSTIQVDPQDPIKIGSAPAVVQYFEEFRMSALVITTGVTTIITGYTAGTSINDTGLTPMNLATGVWTCPQDGIYSFSMAVSWAAWTADTRVALEIRQSGVVVAQQDVRSDSGACEVHREIFLTKGTTSSQVVFQATGANKTISVAQNSLLTIRRVL